MSLSTLEQRKKLFLWIDEIIARAPIVAGNLDWPRTRTSEGAPGTDIFNAISLWVLMETSRALDRDGYQFFRHVDVWDAWSDSRWIGDVDWLGTRRRQSEQFKTVLWQIGPGLMRLELRRVRGGRRECFCRVEGEVRGGVGSTTRVVSFV